jgi:hypothetical protein
MVFNLRFGRLTRICHGELGTKRRQPHVSRNVQTFHRPETAKGKQMLKIIPTRVFATVAFLCGTVLSAEDFPKPYSPPCTERENVFVFTEKPQCRFLGDDKYEITFTVKGACDVTVGIIDEKDVVVRHVASGVLGANAPVPFQKNSLKQKLYWDGKDDLDAYIRTPSKLRVRVMLGLKPEFDKLLGDGGHKNLPGYIWGLACNAEGAYVFYKGRGTHGHVGAKRFDRDGNYVSTLVPPPANMPEAKLAGWSFVEYERGQKALQGADGHDSVARDGYMLLEVNGKRTADCQPGLIGNRLYFCSAGSSVAGKSPSSLYWINTDGSTDLAGLHGVPLFPKENASHPLPRFTASPDGKWLYMLLSGMGGQQGSVGKGTPAVFRISTAGDSTATAFIGNPQKPGSDNQSFNDPLGLDCDAHGRIYVCDYSNNRVQIFSPDGKFLKSVVADRPHLVRVHKKTGAFYVVHCARVEGKTIARLSKFASLDNPHAEFHVDHLTAAAFALDSWSAKPRLWLAGEISNVSTAGADSSGPGVRIFEDDGKTLNKIADFDEEAKKTAGENYIGRFSAASVGPGGKVVCDTVREEVFWEHSHRFDLKSGAYRGQLKIPKGGTFDDMAFDKRGYVHVHLNPGFDCGGVLRFDPAQQYEEVPYDYGVERPGKYSPIRIGAIPVKDQPGAKFFQDGLGVNMKGDVAENCNIYYVPKMDDYGKDMAMSTTGIKDMTARGEYNSSIGNKYAESMKKIMEAEKRGDEVYFIRRKPGIPLAGATIWTFDWTGELRAECAAIVGKHIAGVQIDENGKLYFVTSRPRMFGERHFLSGQGGTYGDPETKNGTVRNPFTGTLLKTAGKDVVFLMSSAPIPLEPLPTRPPDVIDISFANVFGKSMWTWVEGAEWLYAGASPIVSTGCTCPTLRAHTDWYQRTFVSEAYRHSIGVVDTNGNLIMHIGRYGNYDSWHGPQSKIPVGGDGIGLLVPRMMSGTDNYLCFQDWGERLVVLKLNYHAEEIVPINMK